MKKLQITLFVLLAVMVVADAFIPKEHTVLAWEAVPGFYALFGVVASILLLVVSKVLGHFFIQKRENYYDD